MVYWGKEIVRRDNFIKIIEQILKLTTLRIQT